MMSRQIYNVIEMLRKLSKQYDTPPGKKKFQKLVYLVENVGNVNLGFSYKIHFFGPYSDKLDDTLTNLQGKGLIYYDYKEQSHLICLHEIEDYDDFYEADLDEHELKKIEEIFSIYGGNTPNQLELLTTTHFAFENLKDKSNASVIKGVQKIKGTKYSEKQIEDALGELGLM